MLENRGKDSSFAGDPYSLLAKFRRACTHRSPISCSGSENIGGSNIFGQRTSSLVFGPRIQGPEERRHQASKGFDFGRIVDVGGLLSSQEVGASTALFGALRGWNKYSWNFEIILDDEFWYVTPTLRTVSLHPHRHQYHNHPVLQNDTTKNARI